MKTVVPNLIKPVKKVSQNLIPAFEFIQFSTSRGRPPFKVVIMGKDPAVLFYTGDFLTGTEFLTDEETGKYIKLLCKQHQLGHIPKNHMISICGSDDSPVIKKFIIDSEGNYYNKRMEEEKVKRENYCKSRSNNKSGRKKKESYDNSYENHMSKHMGNENENENENENINKKKKTKHKYGNYNHILLTGEEKEKLIKRFGREGTISRIKNMDEAIELKGYKYKSHYLAILKWEKNNTKEETDEGPVI